MKQYILDKGWYFSRKCNCSGINEYYKHTSYPEWEIGLGANKFRIKQNGTVKAESRTETFEPNYNQFFA